MKAEQRTKRTAPFYPLTRSERVETVKDLTSAKIKVLYYVRSIDPSGDRNLEYSVSAIASELGLSKGAVSKAIRTLEQGRLIEPGVFSTSSNNNLECQIRNRLHAVLGGLTEVTTPAGRIDLLTEAEIIEVKAIKDWKAALGQVLIYSAFYPQHQKRLHLFGTASELEALADIEAAVISFGIKVMGEEVQA
ncbi:hypothetical protein C7Y66_10995 [Chroococcidiopsis sp. CCALA 051]|uniref:MarR family transcriptional regulator n=1 Tax=Chroococcidiopsis sp. CCALA 051 TaxID=869949 RepID=UPI000D0DB51D|nr:helix-turn-helix domain-containing protein [Chroococcidiopsis sp. CCALA 051]MBE9018893.1 MarR family transcriptional regulator [Chroococcidiopsidales cyanobacterium LEGE 13417]PSM49140.1 hypothetical protein C7Y66_10995 [Chroococcidiopsis sp. CCALA 051]